MPFNRFILAAALLLPLAAQAQTANPVAIPVGTAGTLIPAVASRSLRYQVQGTGYACVSWITSSVTITGTDGTAKCGGAGSFLVTGMSTDNRLYPAPVNSTPLYGVGAAGSSLQVAFEIQ